MYGSNISDAIAADKYNQIGIKSQETIVTDKDQDDTDDTDDTEDRKSVV